MNALDNLKNIRRLDKQNVLGSIDALADQIQHAWRESTRVRFPSRYRKARKVVVVGMGGSMIGTHLIETVFSDSLRVPLVRVGDYQLPKWVGTDTLVILSSYSGTTEEVVHAGKEALARGCMVTALSVGGMLGRMMRTHRLPFYHIVPTYNSSNQPRMATGYMVFGLLGMLARLGYVRISSGVIRRFTTNLQAGRRRWGVASPFKANRAKSLAQILLGKYILFVAAEHLIGSAHVMANQINENAKQFAAFFPLPELDHHLLEALKFPRDNRWLLTAICFQSQRYNLRNRRRVSATVHIFRQQSVPASIISVNGPTKIEQAIQMVQLGAYTGFYLAILNHLNPAPIPWVDAFKRIMAR